MDVLRNVTILTVLLAFPASLGGALYCWRLYREDRRDYPGDRLRFSLILALTSTLAAIGSTLLAITALIVVFNLQLRLISTPSLYIAIIILDVIPIVNALYLRLRRGTTTFNQEEQMYNHGSNGEPLPPDS